MHLYQWSVFFLGSCSLLCLIGLASPRFHDNLFMCIGMCLLAIGTGSRAFDLIDRAPDMPWDWFFVHAGVGMYAIGQLFDSYLKERRRRFLAFAHSTFERMHGWPARAEATNHPILRNNAGERRSDR